MPYRYALGPDARTRELERALKSFGRVAICGAPNVGKTTLVDLVTDRYIVHADTWRDEPWAAQPPLIIAACAPLERFVVEGLQVARAIRQGLEVDVLLWLVTPMAEQTPKQKATGKGAITVFESIRDGLQIPIVIIP